VSGMLPLSIGDKVMLPSNNFTQCRLGMSVRVHDCSPYPDFPVKAKGAAHSFTASCVRRSSWGGDGDHLEICA
jgi:hypothetical protein